jgi:8-oxo-dGTP pyrophosphatase MutT (NUDIX family)
MHRQDWLRELLSAYAPGCPAEGIAVARMLALLEGSADPFVRSNYAPGHFTASGFVVSSDGSEVLLIFHSKLARWLQPGGHIEATDLDVEAAARRELREEVGLKDLVRIGGIFDLDIHTIPPLGHTPAHEHFDIRFCFRHVTGATIAGSDAVEARWVPLPEVVRLNSDESVRRAVGKLPERMSSHRKALM